jgi:copper chaperone CopZ
MTATSDNASPPAPIETSYGVTGMTCEHCVAAVSAELRALDSVRDVAVELVAGGTSTVTVRSDSALDPAAVQAAIDEAGYELAGATGSAADGA